MALRPGVRIAVAAPFLLVGAVLASQAGAVPEPSASPSIQTVLQRFASPPAGYGPAPIWWWSGERLDVRRLEWQLDRMVEGHVREVVIANLAPVGPRQGSQADVPPFLSPPWWNTLRQVLAKARARGMRVWLSDQLGTASGAAQGQLMVRQPAWRAQELRLIEKEIVGPVRVRMAAPGRALAACAVPLDADGSHRGPVAHISTSLTDGYLDKMMPEGRWKIMLFHEAPGGFDYMNGTAAARLINLIHGEYERKLRGYLGSTIAGIVTDDLPPMNRWTRGFLEEFRRRKGYDLRPRLPYLWYDLGPLTARVRCDVAEVQDRLLERAYFGPLRAWHERNRVRWAGGRIGAAELPGADGEDSALRPQLLRWLHAPGGSDDSSIRPLSSLAHLYRRPRAWLSGFHRRGWAQSLEEASEELHDALIAGATLYSPSAWYYATLGGWWEWRPPDTSFRQPYWAAYSLFADYTARLCYVLSQGSHVCDLAVLYPSSTIRAGTSFDGSESDTARRARLTFRTVCDELNRRGIDYDILDEESLLHARVEKGRLRVAGEAYRAALLPQVTTLPRAAARTLAGLARSGGFLAVAGELPRASTDAGADDPALRNIVRALTAAAPTAEAEGSVLALPGLLVAPESTANLVGATVARLPAHARGVARYLHRRIGGRDVYLLIGKDSGTARVTLLGSGQASVLLPYSGTVAGATTAASGDRVALRIDFAESRAALVVLDGSGAPGKPTPPATADAPATKRKPIPLSGPWRSALVPTLDNRWGDFARPASADAMPAECRSFQYREETPGRDGIAEGFHLPDTPDTQWSRVTATYGAYWWMTRPGIGDKALRLPGPEDGDWRPDRKIWQPVVFSMRYGIEKDPTYLRWGGPKGRVPDEYLDFGDEDPGTVRWAVTFVHVDEPCDVRLRFGPGDVRVAVNSVWLPAGNPVTAHLLAGYNAVAIQVRHPAQRALRTYVHIGPARDGVSGISWIWTRSRADVSDCFARRSFTLEERPVRAALRLTVDNGYEVYVNGQRVGREAGGSASDWATAERYAVGSLLRKGKNVVAIHGVNLGGPAGIAALLTMTFADGSERVIPTDGTWKAARTRPAGAGQSWAAAAYDDRDWPTADPVAPYPSEPWGVIPGLLSNEPSILPDSGELNGAVLPWAPNLVMDPRPGLAKPVGWYRFRTPPGAVSMRLSLLGTYRVFIDGQEVVADASGVVAIPEDLVGPSRVVALRVEQAAGRYGGAAFRDAVRFAAGPGAIEAGDWAQQGLPQWSGGVTYRRTVVLAASWLDGPTSLDLGEVGGIAAVTINGRSAGIRLWSPYRFPVGDLLKPGSNVVQVTVYNTLAAYYGSGAPTPYALPGDTISGLIGPVLLTPNASPDVPRTASGKPAYGGITESEQP